MKKEVLSYDRNRIVALGCIFLHFYLFLCCHCRFVDVFTKTTIPSALDHASAKRNIALIAILGKIMNPTHDEEGRRSRYFCDDYDYDLKSLVRVLFLVWINTRFNDVVVSSKNKLMLRQRSLLP